jgi:hypothetical protein
VEAELLPSVRLGDSEYLPEGAGDWYRQQQGIPLLARRLNKAEVRQQSLHRDYKWRVLKGQNADPAFAWFEQSKNSPIRVWKA